jgi:hypothetical protein
MRATNFFGYLFPMVVMTACGLFAADLTPSELKAVQSAIEPAILKLDPFPEIGYLDDGRTLLVAYKTQTYKVHGKLKTGEVSPETRDEMGPGYKGFILRVHLQDAGEINQAVTPQTVHEPYWQTDLDVTALKGTKKQIYWGLSYGAQTDTQLLSNLKRKIGELKTSPLK